MYCNLVRMLQNIRKKSAYDVTLWILRVYTLKSNDSQDIYYTMNASCALHEKGLLRVSFLNGINGLNLPLIRTEKNGYSLYFLIDTGANKNYIRQDMIDIPEINTDTISLDETEEYFGIDNVYHEAKTCNFRFSIEDYNYTEKFQIIKDGSALTFPTTNGSLFHVVGILGTPFMIKHKSQINFLTSEISISLPIKDNNKPID